MSDAHQTLRGSCHCGAVVFEITGPPIDKGIRCNCSICRRRNAVMSPMYYKPGFFTLLQGEVSLKRYHFGDKVVDHAFCASCGIYTFHSTVGDPSSGVRVNLCCIEDIDIYTLPTRLFDGRETWTWLD